MITSQGAALAIQKNAHNRAIELLHGLVTGIVADQQLHDLEIAFLNNWLLEHPAVATEWPGSVIAQAIRSAMADGVITEPERQHLLGTLREMAVTDFSATGSAAAEVMQLPINDRVEVDLRDCHICLTGEFLFGTRNKCEQITTACGGYPVSNVTKKVAYLVIGTNVSPAWVHTSYGRKIEAAVALQSGGHPIQIISERRWIEVVQSHIE